MEIADLYYLGWRRGASRKDKRIEGYLVIPSRFFACAACSGSTSKDALPEGRYVASNFRERTEAAMVRDGVGFSVDLSDKYDPAIRRQRQLLRIHPDGGKPGTLGCIGILTRLEETRSSLRSLFVDSSVTRSLIVTYTEDRQLIALVRNSLQGC